ncbi:hypothetical protein [Nocardiopsis tropica]|uniref:Uncharacterized protein n=1 Tax=Nocardiopsis tropica TaxID=109330 RepID=A0ABU7KS05_9ACTN|nr:hypothetical protein [Nocardiopsis umidischolae]MEE2051779.1 hypothetical protein [Nocardiopsis umidischolae]
MTELDRILSVIRTTGFVARDGRDGANVYRAGVYTLYGTSVTVTAWDGISHSYEATVWRTLDQQLAGFRQATTEEVTEFKRLEARRPAPSNWD